MKEFGYTERGRREARQGQRERERSQKEGGREGGGRCSRFGFGTIAALDLDFAEIDLEKRQRSEQMERELRSRRLLLLFFYRMGDVVDAVGR